MNDQNLKTLQIVENELNRLLKKSFTEGLTKDETHKLDLIFKIQQILMGQPTEIKQELTKVSDKEILKILKPTKNANKTKATKRTGN